MATEVARERAQSAQDRRTARPRISAPPGPRPRQKGYAKGTLALAKQYQIAPHEVAGWQATPKADEVVAYHASRARGSLASEGVRRLAAAMLEQCAAEARLDRSVRAGWRGPRDYKPNPDTAVAWFLREDDRPLSYRWVCQVLGYDPDAIRAELTRWAGRSRRFR